MSLRGFSKEQMEVAKQLQADFRKKAKAMATKDEPTMGWFVPSQIIQPQIQQKNQLKPHHSLPPRPQVSPTTTSKGPPAVAPVSSGGKGPAGPILTHVDTNTGNKTSGNEKDKNAESFEPLICYYGDPVSAFTNLSEKNARISVSRAPISSTAASTAASHMSSSTNNVPSTINAPKTTKAYPSRITAHAVDAVMNSRAERHAVQHPPARMQVDSIAADLIDLTVSPTAVTSKPTQTTRDIDMLPEASRANANPATRSVASSGRSDTRAKTGNVEGVDEALKINETGKPVIWLYGDSKPKPGVVHEEVKLEVKPDGPWKRPVTMKVPGMEKHNGLAAMDVDTDSKTVARPKVVGLKGSRHAN